MWKQLAVACAALAFATQAASQTVIEKAKQREAQEQQKKQQQQQAQKKAAPAPAAGTGATRNPITKKIGERCNRNADGRKLSGDARKRYMDQCMQGKG